MTAHSLPLFDRSFTTTATLLLLIVIVFTPITSNSADRPNVILFIADDVSWNDYGCYGNKAARTPNIDQLATDGLRFTNAYLTASSCSPSRSSIITGRYPHNNGKAAELHLAIDWQLEWFPELLRDAGYYTAIVGKHHMKSSQAPPDEPKRPPAFDLVDSGRAKGNRGGHANWVKTVKERPKDKPFFFWFASYDAHRGWEADTEWDKARYGEMHRPEDVVVPPFLVDDAETRQDLASYYNEVTRFDHFIGAVVAELKEQNVLKNTLILVMADNGRPFPRAKTRLHDSGMKTALVAHWPDGIQKTGVCDGLVSAIDLAPTILQLAGTKVPRTMQGVSIQPLFADPSDSVRNFAFSEHNWHDYEAHGRSVRDTNGMLYIRNSRPYLAWQGPADSVRSPSHRSLQASRDAKKLSTAQADVFLAPRPMVELYNTVEDPHQLNNLAANPKFSAIAKRLGKVLDQWTEETADTVPEKLSQDSFDRETGRPLKVKNYRQTTPGEERGAARINAAGPR